MTVFYTVDRSYRVCEGDKFELKNDFSEILISTIKDILSREEVINLIEQEFPMGLSNHGVYYLLNNPILINQIENNNYVPISPMIEAIFEQIRRVSYSHLPSRMVSMFAWQEINEAVTFANSLHTGQYKILEVETENYFIGDMNLLKLGGQVANAYAMAHKYWKQEYSSNPNLEVLIPLPVTLGKEV